MELLREKGAEGVLVFGGGIIPDGDIPKLKKLGVAAVFTPGTPMKTISEWLRAELDQGETVDA